MSAVRSILADNPGPFTLEGTRTHIVGRRQPAVIDPGPASSSHIEAIARAVAGAPSVEVLVTHRHGDHVAGVDMLRGALEAGGARVDVSGAGHPAARPLRDGEVIPTDAGPLTAIPTPGHAAEHLAFYWADGRALFAGDMVLGSGDTTWVAEYPGCVADYLRSLDRLEALELDVIYPAHGPDITDPAGTLRRYRDHRQARIDRVRTVMEGEPGADVRRVLDRVYGKRIPAGLTRAALASAEALVEYVTGELRKGPGMSEPEG